MNISRRTLLGASLATPVLTLGASNAAKASSGGYGSSSNLSPSRIPAGFSLFATAPDALADVTQMSKSIQALAVHGDDLYYGYGDYDKNSGSLSGLGTNLSCINIPSKKQRVVIPNVRTEAFLSLRNIDGNIVAPVIDQTDGNQILAMTNGKNSQILVGPGMEHTFDVCAAGPYLIAVGSGSYNNAPGSIAYEYDRLTRTWNETPVFSNLTPGDQASDNWTRYYWTRSIGPYVFAQDGYDDVSCMTRYNVFTKKIDKLPNAAVIPTNEMSVINYRDHIIMCNGNNIMAMDVHGKHVASASLSLTAFAFGLVEYHGVLYMATSEGIFASTNVKTWTKKIDADIEFNSYGDQGWFSMAIYRDHVYLGGDNGRIIKSNNPII